MTIQLQTSPCGVGVSVLFIALLPVTQSPHRSTVEANTFSRAGSHVPRIGGGDGALRRSLFRGRPRAAALSAIVPTLAVPKGATLFFLRGGDSRVGIATIMAKRRSADRRYLVSSPHQDRNDRARSQCDLMKYEKRAETRLQACNAYAILTLAEADMWPVPT